VPSPRVFVIFISTNKSLEFIHGEQEGIEILALHGDLIFGLEDLDLRQELDSLIKAGKIRAAFNFINLSKLDSTGLGTLLFAREELRKAGGNLAIFNLNRSHIELLVEMQLETSFDVFPTEADAVDSFFPDRQIKRYDILEFVESLKRKKPKP
jgi:anti-sigma B factor antagonist